MTRQFPSRNVEGARPKGARSAAEWADEIRTLMARGRSHARELTIAVHSAKMKLPYGEWTELWRSETAPFSKRKADMLAAIGGALGRLDEQTFAHLPTGWSILYRLAQINRPTLMEYITKGRIHPGLSLAEAKDLLAESRGQRAPDRERRSRVRARLNSFSKFVCETCSNWSVEERFLAMIVLTNVLHKLEAVSDPNGVETHHVDSAAENGSRRKPNHNTK